MCGKGRMGQGFQSSQLLPQLMQGALLAKEQRLRQTAPSGLLRPGLQFLLQSWLQIAPTALKGRQRLSWPPCTSRLLRIRSTRLAVLLLQPHPAVARSRHRETVKDMKPET